MNAAAIAEVLSWVFIVAGSIFVLIGGIGALVNFAVAYVVSKVTPDPPEHIQHLVESVRIPRGAKAVDGEHIH